MVSDSVLTWLKRGVWPVAILVTVRVRARKECVPQAVTASASRAAWARAAKRQGQTADLLRWYQREHLDSHTTHKYELLELFNTFKNIFYRETTIFSVHKKAYFLINRIIVLLLEKMIAETLQEQRWKEK